MKRPRVHYMLHVRECAVHLRVPVWGFENMVTLIGVEPKNTEMYMSKPGQTKLNYLHG